MSFEIVGEQDMEYCTNEIQHDILPFWFTDMSDWISKRSAAKHRKHVQKILEECGGKTLSGFITLTHCLSLTDTLWVKKDSENILWSDVSLYTNSFSDVISKLSFDGTGLCGQQISTTSPELTTDGLFDKCWIREKGIKLLKAGSSGASNAGREPYSEVIASPIYEKLCNGIMYTLRKYHGKTVSCCDIFTSEKYGFKSMIACGINTTVLPLLLKEFSKYGAEDLFRSMIVADAVTINNDRHLGNFGFIIDNDTYTIVGMAPVFDYNQAMFPYADWYKGFPDMESWIMERGPKIGNDYYSSAEHMITPRIRSELINLKDLELTVDIDEKFDKGRIAIVNKFKNLQINKILGNQIQFDFINVRNKFQTAK